ncbi:hypothetical protein ODJ79_13575 [Actinoplanes sp. KI2]|uniref:hypothetical protein n=1 Tax=Actinoplanes sp. KI2 TaxID=2983315 RepID=UPI0021D59B9D|nr:hypothetical protein [Actinoplanes sp. KI2]MCU7724749.1 hypothetical protein [Actinoplanes sp. KI2]
MTPPAADLPEHVAAGALLNRTSAYLTVENAASRVQVSMATLPGLLYRISTAGDSGLEPRVTARNGVVRARLLPTGADGPDEVRIVLNRGVRWAISLPAGAGEQQLDLRRGRLARVDLGASGLLEMHLPAPAGTVPVTLHGAVGSLVLTGGPVRLELDRGVGSAVLPWGTSGITQTPGWSNTSDRYAIRARAAVGTLIVRTDQDE